MQDQDGGLPRHDPETPGRCDAGKEDSDSRVRADRRRLIIAGLSAAPFLLTLAATPARASGMGSLGTYAGDYDDAPDEPDQAVFPAAPGEDDDAPRYFGSTPQGGQPGTHDGN